MQLEIYNPADGQVLPPIDWNFAELKAWLEDGLTRYKGRVYDESQITEAKKDAATLRKLSAAIDNRRKEMKARYLEPYALFESQAKELTGMIDAQVAEISGQVKAYDEARKAEKLAHIKAMFAEVMGDLANLVDYDMIHDKRWLNVTYSMQAVETDLVEIADKIRTDLQAINSLSMDENDRKIVLHVFFTSLSLSNALREKDRIDRERQKMAEYEARKKQEAEQAAQQTAQKVVNAADPKAFETAKPGDVVRFGGAGCVSADVQGVNVVDFRVWATDEQLLELKGFLKNKGIRYGKVPG